MSFPTQAHKIKKNEDRGFRTQDELSGFFFWQFKQSIYSNPHNMHALLYTLEVNKIESSIQALDQLTVFRKTYTDTGLVICAEPRREFVEIAQQPREHFSNDELLSMVWSMADNEKHCLKIGRMLSMNNAERKIQEQYPNAVPFFEKKYDDMGFPINFRINDKFCDYLESIGHTYCFLFPVGSLDY